MQSAKPMQPESSVITWEDVPVVSNPNTQLDFWVSGKLKIVNDTYGMKLKFFVFAPRISKNTKPVNSQLRNKIGQMTSVLMIKLKISLIFLRDEQNDSKRYYLGFIEIDCFLNFSFDCTYIVLDEFFLK